MTEPISTIFNHAKTTVQEPPIKTRPAVDIEILAAIDTAMMEDSFVYVHCHFDSPEAGYLVRIWSTTFLMDMNSAVKSKLVHAENVSMAPQWTYIAERGTFTFLLVFSALPKSCTHFDLIEEIPQPGGFHVTNIPRNQQDVYHITLK